MALGRGCAGIRVQARQVPDLAVTYYRSLMDTQPHARHLTWEQLRADLRTYRAAAGSKMDRQHSCPLWSPVQLRPGCTRSSAAVLYVSALVLDYDTQAEIGAALAQWAGLEAVAYTTWSHSPAAPRCRVVLPLATSIAGSIWADVYARATEHLQPPLAPDRQCKDPSRAYFVPAVGCGGLHRSRYQPGSLLDLRPTAAAVQQAQEAHRQAQEARRATQRQRRGQTIPSTTGLAREAQEALRHDPSVRQALAERVGAAVVESAGSRKARGAPCPSCGRGAVWWAVDGTGWARCNHRNSCGYEASLYDYGATQ